MLRNKSLKNLAEFIFILLFFVFFYLGLFVAHFIWFESIFIRRVCVSRQRPRLKH